MKKNDTTKKRKGKVGSLESLKRTCNNSGEMDQELRREAVAASAGLLIPLGHRRDLGFVPQESPCLPKEYS